MEKLQSVKEINSVRCQTPQRSIIKVLIQILTLASFTCLCCKAYFVAILFQKKQIPQMSLYKEILRRKALKEIQKTGTKAGLYGRESACNKETYTIARSHEPYTVGSIRKQIIGKSPVKSVKPPESTRANSNQVNRLLYEHFCLNADTVYQNMEELCAILETELGDRFVVLHHALKEAIITKKAFDEVTVDLDNKCNAYFPLMMNLIQLEVLAKQSIL